MLIFKDLPTELKLYISKYIYEKCSLCFIQYEYWNIYNLQDIFYFDENFFIKYFYSKKNKRICLYCFSMIKNLFKYKIHNI